MFSIVEYWIQASVKLGKIVSSLFYNLVVPLCTICHTQSSCLGCKKVNQIYSAVTLERGRSECF